MAKPLELFESYCFQSDAGKALGVLQSNLAHINFDTALMMAHHHKRATIFQQIVRQFGMHLTEPAVNDIFMKGCRCDNSVEFVAGSLRYKKECNCDPMLICLIENLEHLIIPESFESAFITIRKNRHPQSFNLFMTKLRDRITPELCNRTLISITGYHELAPDDKDHIKFIITEFKDHLTTEACSKVYQHFCSKVLLEMLVFMLENVADKIDRTECLSISLLEKCVLVWFQAGFIIIPFYTNFIDREIATKLVLRKISHGFNPNEILEEKLVINYFRDKIDRPAVLRAGLDVSIFRKTRKLLFELFYNDIDASVTCELLRKWNCVGMSCPVSIYDGLVTLEQLGDLVSVYGSDPDVSDALADMDPDAEYTQYLLGRISQKIKAGGLN